MHSQLTPGLCIVCVFTWPAGRRLARRSAIASVLAPFVALPVAANDLANKSPNEVVQFLLDVLANNDTPSTDAGLKTFVSAASPTNPATKDAAKFISVIKSSPYSILLGKYDAMRMAKANEGILKRSVPFCAHVASQSSENSLKLRCDAAATTAPL